MRYIAGLLLAVVIVTTLWHNQPRPSTNDLTPVKTKHDWFAWRNSDDGDGTLVVTDRESYKSGTYRILDNRLYMADKKQHFDATYYRAHYWIDPGVDIGTWGGYGAGFQHHYQVGLRASPARLIDGIVAPDAVIARDRFGLGVSLYAPDYLVDSPWNRVGLGAWYTIPVNTDDRPTWTFGISMSIHR